MNELVTVKTAITRADMLVAKSYLEDNGIECSLKNELFAQVHPVGTLNGIELQVMKKDAEKALELLISGGFAKEEEYEEYSDWLMRLVEKVIAKLSGE